MVIEEYLRIFTRWWWLLILSTLVAAGSSYYTVSRSPRVYQATTTVIIGQSLSRSNPNFQDFAIGQQLAQTYVNMVQREPILQGAAAALDLDYVPWSGNVGAHIVPGTQLVEISVRDTSPERAQALADGIAHQLILQAPDDPADSQARRTFIEGQLQALERSIASTEEEIADQQVRLAAANSARTIQQHQTNIEALQQRLGTYQASYASLLHSADGGINYISIIEPARLPTVPISPRVGQTVGLAAMMGMVLAAGGAFLIEAFDNTVKTTDDVAQATELPTLGTISVTPGGRYVDRLPSAFNPQSPVSESFRALRTNIQYCAVNRQLRTLLLTSPTPGEGKSFVLANLAIVMAQSGLAVWLVDADLRRPVQGYNFALSQDESEQGLNKALLETEVDLEKYSVRLDPEVTAERLAAREPEVGQVREFILGDGSVTIIPAGKDVPYPADLLGSQRMKNLVKQLGQEADIVLFDTPPTLAVTDAVVLASEVDGVLLVAQAGHTKRAALREAVQRLNQVEATVVGVILNRASVGDRGYYPYEEGTSWPSWMPQFVRNIAKSRNKSGVATAQEAPVDRGKRLRPPSKWGSDPEKVNGRTEQSIDLVASGTTIDNNGGQSSTGKGDTTGGIEAPADSSTGTTQEAVR